MLVDMKPCKTIYPAKGWLRVLWPKAVSADYERVCLAAGVHEIPGCKLQPSGLDVPYTAWMLPHIEELLEELGAKLPPIHVIKAPLYERVGERKLYEYQLDGVEFIFDHPGVVLADEMGLGKTLQAAVAVHELIQQYRRPALIIGTLAVQAAWRRELTALGFVQSDFDFCALEGRDPRGPSFWKGASWYFIHFEIVKPWWNTIYNVHPCAVIIDEAHNIKNGQTQRSRGAMMATSGSLRRVLLTGTPLENRPSDLWHPLTVACGPRTWGYPNEFRTRYCGAESNGYHLVDTGPTNVAELRARLGCVFLRRSTRDAGIDLPDFVRTPFPSQLGAYQAEYDAVAKSLELFEEASLKQLVRMVAEGMVEKVLPELTRMRQITSRAKVASTREYVLNALEQGEHVVVFTWERETATSIYNGLGNHDKYLVHGGVSQKLRDAAIVDFQASEEPSAFVTTYGAMAEGVTLHRARICALHDLDWKLSAMLQAEKRVHRLGQRRSCQAVWMLAQGTLDTLIAPVLLRKAELMEEILGIRHDIRDSIGLSELAGRPEADRIVEQVFAAWEGMMQ